MLKWYSVIVVSITLISLLIEFIETKDRNVFIGLIIELPILFYLIGG